MKLLLLLFICFSTTYAEDYIVYHTKINSDASTSHFISNLDLLTGSLSNSTILGNAENQTPLLYIDKKNKLLSALIKTNDREDVAIILDKKSFHEKARINIPKVKWPDTDMYQVPPIFISENDKQLIVISKGREEQEINIYEIKTGQRIYNRKLGKHDYKVSRTKDKNYLIFENKSARNQMLIVIDIINHKTSAIASFGNTSINTHVFQNSMYVSTEHSLVKNKYYSLEPYS